MPAPIYEPLNFRQLTPEQMQARSDEFYAEIALRRTVRHFSDRPVPRSIIEQALRAAGTAPNGANLQPWHFVAVSDPAIKRRIREAAEEEEREFYTRRATSEWLDALEHLGTDHSKPFLETAPYLIAIFGQPYSLLPGDNGEKAHKVKNYYVVESVGIATGFLIAALHHAGLASLTHTPSPWASSTRSWGVQNRSVPFCCWSSATQPRARTCRGLPRNRWMRFRRSCDYLAGNVTRKAMCHR